MATVVESPNRRLRRELGLDLDNLPRSERPTVTTWMGIALGTEVSRRDDHRHVGKVRAIHNSAIVLVQWSQAPHRDWFERVSLSDLERAS